MEFASEDRRIRKDRLSNLLPDLRTHIISFLPTKEAIKLGVLSTQWRYPCSSLPRLEFNIFKESDGKHKEMFKNCLHKTLTYHETQIVQFSLRVEVDDKHITNATLNDWITIVLQHHVANLFLRVYSNSNKTITLPSPLFTCSTLRELTLRQIQLPATSNLRFPMVRKLGLECVTFCGEDDDLGNRLFSPTIFPVLQSLVIVCCGQINTLSISIPSFVYLLLCTCLKHPKFHLSIPTLQQFECKVMHRHISGIEFSPDTISSLHTATLGTFIFGTEYPPTSTNASTILSAMGKIETLDVADHFVECLSWDQSFVKITRSLSFRIIRFSLGMFPTNRHVQVIKFLTSCFPLLESLEICFTDMKEYMVSHQENKLELLMSEDEDQIMLRHLRQVIIKDFRASDCGVELVSYLVSCASNLEVMRVSCHKEISPHDRMAIDLKLKSLPKVSQNLKLVCR